MENQRPKPGLDHLPDFAKLALADLIAWHFQDEFSSYEAYHKECPEADPNVICIHDLRVMTMNILNDVLLNLGYQMNGDDWALEERQPTATR